MTKRTKRNGGFRIGDRVRVKGKQYEWLKEGVVKALKKGYCSVYFKENSELLSEPVYYCFRPNELINLTRIEEERESEIEERLKRMGMENWKPEDHDIMPSKPFDKSKTPEEWLKIIIEINLPKLKP